MSFIFSIDALATMVTTHLGKQHHWQQVGSQTRVNRQLWRKSWDEWIHTHLTNVGYMMLLKALLYSFFSNDFGTYSPPPIHNAPQRPFFTTTWKRAGPPPSKKSHDSQVTVLPNPVNHPWHRLHQDAAGQGLWDVIRQRHDIPRAPWVWRSLQGWWVVRLVTSTSRWCDQTIHRLNDHEWNPKYPNCC